MFPASSKSGDGGTTVTFPDVCKMPGPPAPFVPIAYPNVQFQENLKAANKVDAMTKTGNKEAQSKQKQAIDDLFSQTGITAKSATEAVMLGKTAHGKQTARISGSSTRLTQESSMQIASRKFSTMSNVMKSQHDILSSIINNIRA